MLTPCSSSPSAATPPPRSAAMGPRVLPRLLPRRSLVLKLAVLLAAVWLTVAFLLSAEQRAGGLGQGLGQGLGSGADVGVGGVELGNLAGVGLDGNFIGDEVPAAQPFAASRTHHRESPAAPARPVSSHAQQVCGP